CWRTSSAANSPSRSFISPVQRYSTFTFRPSTYPTSINLLERAADRAGLLFPGDRNPIVGIGRCCCARAASGHAAAPPSPAMNSRRRRQMVIWATPMRGNPTEGIARPKRAVLTLEDFAGRGDIDDEA